MVEGIATMDWLVDSDPTLRWQVERDLLGAPDPRLADAIDLVRAARRPDGTWLQGERYPGRVWFEVDVPVGLPSKWLTFHAARALAWWDDATG